MKLLMLLLVAIIGTLEAKLYPIEYRLPLDRNIEVPTPGNIWPKPHKQTTTATQYTLDRTKFRFSTNLESCDIIKAALNRYTELIFLDAKFHPAPGKSVLTEVTVVVVEGAKANCGYPQHGEDELYSISVPVKDMSGYAVIEAKTVWGALRGLETFSQLVYPNEANQLVVNQTEVQDRPRYAYRGLLLDTARHYLPKKIILANLDAMAYNKLNTFHWHLVDDQSFPFVSTRFPSISAKGAYTAKHIYTPADVQDVIEYARMRGIRVIPELDTPGHTHAMARAYPDLLTPCYKNGQPHQPDYPHNSESEVLNPMRPETFAFLRELLAEFKTVFKDEFIHLGMDEVFYSCWKSNPEIGEFMRARNMTQFSELEEYYTRITLRNAKDLGYKYIVWQDPVDNGVTLAPDSVVGVWKDKSLVQSMDLWQDYIAAIAKKKYQIILSACWYLNYITYPYPGFDWERFYACDPRDFNGTEAEKDLVIGGQANIWGEFVDKTNVLSRLWPRASAVAERLWSDRAQTQDLDTARHRLDVQRCRMLRRGIPAAPILNSYCGEWEVPEEVKNRLENEIDFGGRVVL